MRVKIFLGIFAVSSCLSMVPAAMAADICSVNPDLRTLQGPECNPNQSNNIVSPKKNSLPEGLLSTVKETNPDYKTPEAFRAYFLNMLEATQNDEQATKFAKGVLFDMRQGADFVALERLSLNNLTLSQRKFVLDNMEYFFNLTDVAFLGDEYISNLSTFKMQLLESKFVDVKVLLADSDPSFFRRIWNAIKGSVYYMGAPGDLNLGYDLMKRDLVD